MNAAPAQCYNSWTLGNSDDIIKLLGKFSKIILQGFPGLTPAIKSPYPALLTILNPGMMTLRNRLTRFLCF